MPNAFNDFTFEMEFSIYPPQKDFEEIRDSILKGLEGYTKQHPQQNVTIYRTALRSGFQNTLEPYFDPLPYSPAQIKKIPVKKIKIVNRRKQR